MDEVADLLAGYPFDVLLGSVHWMGAWRFDDLSDEVSMAEWSARSVEGAWDAYTGRLEELAASGTCDVLAHPDLIKVTGRAPEHPEEWWDRMAEAAAALGHGRRGVLGRLAQAGGRAVPGPSRSWRACRPGRAAHHRLGRPPPASTWPTGPRTCAPSWPRSGSTSSRPTAAAGPTACPSPRARARRPPGAGADVSADGDR